jgi:dienelactone hydrolase
MTRTASLLAAGLAAAGALAAQTLEVTPARVLRDEPAAIRVSGLQPGEIFTIEAGLEDGGGARWKSLAEFQAGPDGAGDLSKLAPVKGSYKGVSALGLIWSMMPESKGVARYQPHRDMAPQVTEFHMMRQGKQVAAARLEQLAIGEGVERIPVHDGSLRGTLFVPAGKGRHPGVLVVGGSDGGLPSGQAAWLASHGFLALALAYFHYEDLPAMLQAIPLEYFGQALQWLGKRPEVSQERVAVMGTSRGGELALQLGSMFPQITAVVAYVPADVRFPACCGGGMAMSYAWTWHGQPLAFVSRFPQRQTTEGMRARIEVERTQGPILLISGESDHLWPSSEMADAVVAHLKRVHFTYSFENLKYKGAGHSAGQPSISPKWHGEVRHPVSGREIDLGGSPAGDAESTLDSMPKVLEFLKHSLPE